MDVHGSTDQGLVERVKRGDKCAYAQLMAKYRRRIFRLVFGVLKNHADAEDAVQDTFLYAYRALPSFRGDAGFYTWLYRIALNASLNLRKHGHTRTSHEVPLRDDEGWELDAGIQHDTSVNPERALEAKQELQRVDVLLQRMPHQFSEAMMRHVCEGLSTVEIASDSAIAPVTVRSRIFRARQLLNAGFDHADGAQILHAHCQGDKLM